MAEENKGSQGPTQDTGAASNSSLYDLTEAIYEGIALGILGALGAIAIVDTLELYKRAQAWAQRMLARKKRPPKIEIIPVVRLEKHLATVSELASKVEFFEKEAQALGRTHAPERCKLGEFCPILEHRPKVKKD